MVLQAASLFLEGYNINLRQFLRFSDWQPFGNFTELNETTEMRFDNLTTIKDWPNFPPRDEPECGFDGKRCEKTGNDNEKSSKNYFD